MANGATPTRAFLAATHSTFTKQLELQKRHGMFTGIITDIGTIRSAEQRGDLRLMVDCGYDMATVDLGASIACSGCSVSRCAATPACTLMTAIW